MWSFCTLFFSKSFNYKDKTYAQIRRVFAHAYKNIIRKLVIMLYTEMLNDNKIFLLLYKKGKPIISKWLVIYVRKNNLPYNRLGITAGKKVGNAVKRNRAKRVIRQVYRENELKLPIGIDIVIVARAYLPDVKSNVVSKFFSDRVIKEIIKAVKN